MVFFYFNENAKKAKRKQESVGASLETLHKLECDACPLNLEKNLRNPHMEPTGSKHPDVYMIGEAPGQTEDERGRQFVGKAGRVLKMRIPEGWDSRLRWNNVVRCRPPKNREPTLTEIECCRPSIVRDIEATKPKAIFGFGAVPLKWATGEGYITNWSGRYIPVQIGSHKCFFFPFIHPSYVMRTRRWEPSGPDRYGSDVEFAFAHELRRAFDFVETGLGDPIIHTAEQARANIEIVTGQQPEDLARVRQFLRTAAKMKECGLDIETFPLRPFDKDAVLLSIGFAIQNKAMAIAIGHKDAGWSDDDYDQLMQMITEFLCDPAGPRKIVHHLAFEMEWIAYFLDAKEALWRTKWGDTMAQGYILNEKQGMLSLELLVLQYFGINIKNLSNVNRKDLRNEPIERLLIYNAIDAKYHLALYKPQKERLVDEGLFAVYSHHIRRIPACVLTQIKGIPVDQKINRDFTLKLEDQLTDVETEIAQLPDVIKFKKRTLNTFRPSAPKDLQKLFTHLGIHKEAMDDEQLRTVKHPLAALVLKWRDIHKQLVYYVKPLSKENLWPDGLLHPILATMKTRTWRSSSEDPNSQNFPKRKHREVRSQVKHKDQTMKIVAFDYAGIQARNIAMESKDPVLIKSFWDRYDIHGDWRDHLLKLYPKWCPVGKMNDQKTLDDLRSTSKNGFVFPSFFGAQPASLARYLKIPEHVGVELQEMLFDRFRLIKKWHEKTINFYNNHGYVTGLSGFRRRAPISPNELINAPIQADESLIVFDAFSALSEYEEPRFQPNMEIHDDLTFIWPKHEIEKNAETVITEMLRINYDWINVPLGVEMSVGDDWASTKKDKTYFSDDWFGDDPNTGSWDDGTGWANADGLEKTARVRKAKKHVR